MPAVCLSGIGHRTSAQVQDCCPTSIRHTLEADLGPPTEEGTMSPASTSTDRCPGFLTNLILRCAARDELALGALFDHLYPVVSATVSDGTPESAADPLALAAFRRLWEQAPSYDPKVQRPVAWALSEARTVRAEYLQAMALPPDETSRRQRINTPWITWVAPAIVSPR